ncbi:conserved hypothetical protein [Trichinella spiralis]|uniref:hypothetical protein n=1 Tax=Trichinella spiralis TaxID=6334 RepID=UPI0001EFC734|nr:conserved hypothetical protein [Trichinella spiralis]
MKKSHDNLWNDHHTRRSIAKQTARPFAWLPVAVVERGVLSILLCFVQASTKRFTSRCRQFTLDRNCQTIYRLQYNESQNTIIPKLYLLANEFNESTSTTQGAKKRKANIITVEICEWWKFCPCSGFGKCPNSVKLSQQRKCSNCGISNVISEMPIPKSHLIVQHLSCKKCIRQDKWTDRQIDVQ